MNNLWQKFSDFLHTANLIPLVVVVSTYHYYQALSSHDPFLVSLPIALFIDLLHFRTVERAVKSREASWKLAAVFTTLIAFGLQWIFYSKPVEGNTLVSWQVILFASIVPVGLAIMAWHHQHQAAEVITDWQRQLIQMQEEAAQMHREAEEERTRARALQEEADSVQAQAKALQTSLAAIQTESAAAQSKLAQVQDEAQQMQSQLANLQSINKAWQSLNQEMQTLALVNAQLLTAQTAAEQLGVHVTTVRRKAKQLNGIGEVR
ncbi:MAG: hypothetical protein IT327_04780 [Anaerolineae bacterium]|nr:hypothetical protein [Anaerolineae bacterium]